MTPTDGTPVRRTSPWRIFCILVIGVGLLLVTAIVIPCIGPISPTAIDAMNRRNAQSLVAVYKNGVAEGVAWAGATRDAKIDAVISGQAPATGSSSDKIFKVRTLTGKHRTGIYPYIGMRPDGALYYDLTGKQPPAPRLVRAATFDCHI